MTLKPGLGSLEVTVQAVTVWDCVCVCVERCTSEWSDTGSTDWRTVWWPARCYRWWFHTVSTQHSTPTRPVTQHNTDHCLRVAYRTEVYEQFSGSVAMADSNSNKLLSVSRIVVDQSAIRLFTRRRRRYMISIMLIKILTWRYRKIEIRQFSILLALSSPGCCRRRL